MIERINSYYAARNPDRAALYDAPPADGVDVVVLGAGLAGLTTALQLARKGQSVVICESQSVGWGASGRNGGFVYDGYSESQSALTRKLGPAHAKHLLDLSREGQAFVRDTIQTAGRHDLIHGHGFLGLLRHPISKAKAHSALDPDDPTISILGRDQLRDYVRSDKYHLGFLHEDAFHIEPLGYAELLMQLARQAGVLFQENTTVHKVTKGATGLAVTTSRGGITARNVVFAGSAYMSGVNGKVDRAVLPVATYVIATEPLTDKADTILPFRGCVGDTRRAGDYYRLVDDNRLLWGGRMTTAKAEPAALADMLTSDILDVFPQLGNFRVDYAWSGLMGYCLHKMPLIASLGDGLWVNTGFGGHGLNTTATGGILIAEAIADGSDRYTAFAPFKATWAGGQIGRLGTQAVYWKRQMQDKWQERHTP